MDNGLKLEIFNITQILPLKIKSEHNVFNLKFVVMGDNLFKIQYKNFYPTRNIEDVKLSKEFIFAKHELNSVLKDICELLLECKVVEINDRAELLGNINIVKTYKVLEKIEKESR